MAENILGGRKEAKGLWAWRLDTLNPGTSTSIMFSVSGLEKGEWNDAEIFYRGNGEVIGATKIDEKLLDELRRAESLEAAELEIEQRASSLEPLKERAEVVVDPQVVQSSEEGQTRLTDYSAGKEMEVEE